jgi:predicted membrane channel-forming protein YqfA (hemolysin III family)
VCDSPEDKAAAERLKSVHNERTKLSATYMNGVAIAAIAVGGLALIAQNHFETMGDLEIGLFFVKLILCLLASFGLHLGASSLLRRIR